MLTTQSHHAKLWLAGSVGNWELAAYQADELKEGLEEAGKLVPDYKGIPVGKMVDDLIMPRIEEVESAIKARDRVKFPAAYDKLTAACNSCHQGSNRGFHRGAAAAGLGLPEPVLRAEAKIEAEFTGPRL